MAHNIFGERFLGQREPAWHRLGLVIDEPIGAVDALERIGSYEVVMEDLITASGIKIDRKAVVRKPTPDDPEHRLFGVVSPNYKLVTPQKFTSCWDETVQSQVETIGSLGKGEEIFISTRLPKFDVKGEEIDNYLLAYSPMNGMKSITLKITPVRVVCQNTLSMALGRSGESIAIEHTGMVEKELVLWLRDIYSKVVDKVAAIKEAYEILANYQVSKGQATKTLEQVYSYSEEPLQENMPQEVWERRHKEWEAYKKTMELRVQVAYGLWSGGGTGMDTEAAKGTAWGLYNSVVELEDYRKGPMISGSRSALVGDRAIRKERAFEQCLELVGVRK